MKVLMTCETYLPRIGGAEVHVDNLFNKLKESGHSVFLVTNEFGEDTNGVLRIPWKKSTVFKLWSNLWSLSKGKDIIHAHYCHRLAFLVGLIGRLRGIPVVITLHGLGILDHPHAPFFARLSHSFYRYFSLQLCTFVISTSEDLALVADRYIKRSKMTVIMNGFDANRFREGVDSEQTLAHLENKQIIMTVRRLVPKNGPHYLIEAMAFLVKSNPSVHYVAVGDGPLREKMEQRVKELGLTEHVTFMGMLDNKLVVPYLAKSEVVVFPSTAESSSIACAEAMGMGKLVVASRVGGLVELLGENNERGYLVNLVPWQGSNYDAPEKLPIDRYQSLAEIINEALKTNSVNSEKKQAAKEFALRELTWEAVFSKTLSVYQKLVI